MKMSALVAKNSSREMALAVGVAGDRAVGLHVVLELVRIEALGIVEVARCDRRPRRARRPSFDRSTPANDPTLPKPCTIIVEPSRSKPFSLAHSVMQCTTPCPVALSRPSVPPEATGLPVTTPLHALLVHDADRVHVRVHGPRHDLRVGAHVGRGDVVVGADVVAERVNEAARDALQLGLATRCAG